MRPIHGRAGRRLRMLTVGAAIVLTVSACEWQMSGFDAARTFHNTAESTLTTSNVGQLSLRFGSMLGTFEPIQTSTNISPAVASSVVSAS